MSSNLEVSAAENIRIFIDKLQAAAKFGEEFLNNVATRNENSKLVAESLDAKNYEIKQLNEKISLEKKKSKILKEKNNSLKEQLDLKNRQLEKNNWKLENKNLQNENRELKDQMKQLLKEIHFKIKKRFENQIESKSYNFDNDYWEKLIMKRGPDKAYTRNRQMVNVQGNNAGHIVAGDNHMHTHYHKDQVISEELEMKIEDLEKTAQDLIQKLGHNFVENAKFNKKDAQESIDRLFELENEHQCALNEKLIINNNQLVALQATTIDEAQIIHELLTETEEITKNYTEMQAKNKKYAEQIRPLVNKLLFLIGEEKQPMEKEEENDENRKFGNLETNKKDPEDSGNTKEEDPNLILLENVPSGKEEYSMGTTYICQAQIVRESVHDLLAETAEITTNYTEMQAKNEKYAEQMKDFVEREQKHEKLRNVWQTQLRQKGEALLQSNRINNQIRAKYQKKLARKDTKIAKWKKLHRQSTTSRKLPRRTSRGFSLVNYNK